LEDMSLHSSKSLEKGHKVKGDVVVLYISANVCCIQETFYIEVL